MSARHYSPGPSARFLPRYGTTNTPVGNRTENRCSSSSGYRFHTPRGQPSNVGNFTHSTSTIIFNFRVRIHRQYRVHAHNNNNMMFYCPYAATHLLRRRCIRDADYTIKTRFDNYYYNMDTPNRFNSPCARVTSCTVWVCVCLYQRHSIQHRQRRRVYIIL